ncbi:McrC family protein [Halocatena pleomorpha]|uniref:Restriction endonuclease n=1 Tax=Halocatena pleomorpha TaxID=1785090 RepID=A0A3P3R5H6_9EURY|nr:restriction endonuclease [Halocatena pleomorpha]RRJ28732.1 restriction endonuclease [Halocatena pleomorpha]
MALHEQTVGRSQSPSAPVPTITLTEHDETQLDTQLSERDREFIEQTLSSQQMTVSFDHERQPMLRTSQYVGIVSLPDGPTIQIRPKAAGDNLLSLLQYAHGTEATTIKQETSIQTGATFIDILAALYLAELEQLIKRGLQQAYRRSSNTEDYLRGRLDLQQQLQRQGPCATTFKCSYDELTYETPANQAILYTVSVLLGLVSDEDLGQSLQRYQTRIRRRVTLRSVRVQEVRDIELTRLSEHYTAILRLTELLLDNAHVDRLERGNRDSYSLLIDMNRVFEDVVERAVRGALESRTDWSIEPQATRRGLVTGGSPSITMRPDILVRDQYETVQFVADAKWKTPESVDNADIYQMVAYQLTDDVSGLLIYPSQEGSLTTNYAVQNAGELAVVELPTRKPAATAEALGTRLERCLNHRIRQLC